MSNTFELVWAPVVNELDERMPVIPQEKEPVKQDLIGKKKKVNDSEDT